MSSILIRNTTVEDLQRAMLFFRGHEIIELPDHGDLIDREALNVTDSWEWIRHLAPVVIPAERSEDE